MITTKNKDVGNTKIRFNRSAEVRYTFEDRIADRFKRDMGIRD